MPAVRDALTVTPQDPPPEDSAKLLDGKFLSSSRSPSLQKNLTSKNLIGGVDHIVFDQRIFQIKWNDSSKICRFFSLGDLIEFKQERNVVVSHSNFFAYARTHKGRYAFKFYPPDSQDLILHELTVNRLLRSHHFATPAMYTNNREIPFFPCAGKLTTCYEFVAGAPAWEKIQDKNIVRQLIENIYLLKEILRSEPKFCWTCQEPLLTDALLPLYKSVLHKSSLEESKIIDVSLRQILKTGKDHTFKSQWLHNNTTLTNFISKRKTIFSLDLSHVRKDYALSDLSALII
ncbi:MAG: hypothetical protein JNN05_04225, partial [Candidatus Omnitrophica bacterium]|nr:hypothetical protein [Candidatus Omnitrophota bacterium]